MKIRSKLVLWFLIFSLFLIVVGYLTFIMSGEALKIAGIENSFLILTIRNSILSLLFLLLIINVITDILILHSISDPITKLRTAAREIGEGKLDSKIKIQSNDEIGELTLTFKKMAEDIKKFRSKLKSYAADLEKEVRKKTKQLRLKVEQLKSLDKMKMHFLSSISHELRTPLTPIRSQLERLLNKNIDEKERKEVLKMILSNSVRLDRLINDFLSVNRIQSNALSIAKRPFFLDEIVEEAIKNQSILAKNKNTEIISKVPKLELLLDRDRILEVFINLINNAIKYSDKSKIIIEARKQESNVLISVKDNGIGVSKEDTKKLFTVFYQVSNEKPGVGLGLFICKGIIGAHGGKIWIKSERKKGTTVYFTIPLNKNKGGIKK